MALKFALPYTRACVWRKITFLMLTGFQDGFWIELGRIWAPRRPKMTPSWGHVRHFWRPSSDKFGPKRVLEAYQHQKRDFSPNTRPRGPERKFGPQDGLQNAPRLAQDGSKRFLKSNLFALENLLKFGLVLGAILVDFGLPNPPFMSGGVWAGSGSKIVLLFVRRFVLIVLGSKTPRRRLRGPETPPRASQEAPRGPQEDPRRLQEGLKSRKTPSKMPC